MIGLMTRMARNPVAANILLLFIILGGVYTGFNITQEVFPDIDLNRIQISASYPGAGPSEVSTTICKPVETALSEIIGIEEIICTAREESASFRVELAKSADLQELLQEIKASVDTIRELPDDVSDITVAKVTRRRELMELVLFGDVPREILFDYASRIKDDLLKIEGVNYIDIIGDLPRELLIEIKPDSLNQYHYTLRSLAALVQKASSDIPAGSVKLGSSQILLRTSSKKSTVSEISDIVIDQKSDGTILRLSDIATIRESLQESDSRAMFNGKAAVIYEIYQSDEATPGQLSENVMNKLEEYRQDLPSTLDFAVWKDRSTMFEDRLNLLIRNAGLGLFLVFLTLALFLELRLALWVMVGIPVSFIGSLIFLPMVGVTINMNSLFAFILVSGIVVDDAVVIGENIYRHMEMGKTKIEAAIDGCLEMAAPVTFAILTSLCAFAPMLFIEGRMGSFIFAIPMIVIAVLSISLLEGLFILPAHLAHTSSKPVFVLLKPIEILRRNFSKSMRWFIDKPFNALIDLSLRYRYSTIALGTVFLSFSIAVINSGIVPMNFFPRISSDSITATIELPTGYPSHKTIALIREVEEKAIAIIDEIDQQAANGKSSYDSIFTRVQAKTRRSRTESTTVTIRVRFKGEDERNVHIPSFSKRWRRSIPQSPEILSLNFRSRMIHFGDDVRITLSHRNTDILQKAVLDLKTSLDDFENIKDIVDSETGGSREFQFSLTREAIALGITNSAFAESLRGAFQGIDSHTISRENQDVDVVVLFPKKYRDQINTLSEMKINTPSGQSISLTDVAEIKEGLEPAAIRRLNQERVIEVTAGIEENVENSDEITDAINNDLLKGLAERYPGLTVHLKGSHERRTKSMNSLWTGFGIALIGIFSLLAVLFKSYLQPFIVMISIPFGIAGAVAGHYILGHSVSFMSLFGLVGLTGVVVNDALILIDAVNRTSGNGEDLLTRLKAATRLRFRPIVITSLTTFAGLGPILFEQSRQAQFLIPTAISLGVGILFATFVTLILVPSLFYCLEDLKMLVKKF